MSAVLSVVNTVFWGLLTLSVLVFVHEGGHFLAARACGVRVTEFFLGMPCRLQLSHKSKKIGTKFGVTPLLLGGYAAICGMEPSDSAHLAEVLACVHRHGRATVDEIAQELSTSPDEALEACSLLSGWAAVVPYYDAALGEHEGQSYYPSTYLAPARDRAGNTVYDGKAFCVSEATQEGEPWALSGTADEFLAQERSHTYLGKGFFKRVFMLIAGIFVNVLCGLLLLMSVYSIVGVSYAVDSNTLGAVEAGSVAANAGIQAGDTITQVGDNAVSDWASLVEAINANATGEETSISFTHDGQSVTKSITLGKDEKLGISAQTEVLRLNPLQSAQVSISYVVETGKAIMQLFNPQKTMEVLDNSTSIVGISVMSSQAAAAGVSSYLSFAALISFSLGLMNLLPIPPLDGGKILIEIVQLVFHRELSLKVQTAVSYVGVALFLALFVYMLRADIIRFIL